MTKSIQFRFLFSDPAHFFSLGCGSGLVPIAPGTFGTLFAWGSFYFFRPHITTFHLLFLLSFALIAGMFLIQKTGKALGDADHKSIVLDEVVPFWWVLIFTPTDFFWQLAAFCLFRFFDIWKPQPARFFDTHVKNGFGVMMDDVIAAVYTLIILRGAAYFLFPR